jgi:hypothetical protein
VKTLLTFISVFFLFLFPTQGQTLLSISPNQGTAGTSLTATITGQNTFFMSSSPQGAQWIKIGANNCNELLGTNYNVIDDDHISADFTIPVGYPNGVYDINVRKANNVITLPASFTVNGGVNYSILSITPSTATENSVLSATITGQNLQALHDSAGFFLRLAFPGNSGNSIVSATNIIVVNPSTLTADFQFLPYCDTGYGTLQIFSSEGCFKLDSAVHVNGYYPKQLVSINPAQGTAGNTLSALITGQNLFFQSASPQGINYIKLQNNNCNQIFGTNIVVTDNDHFTTDFIIPPTATNGVYDVYVSLNNNHTYVLAASYTITNGVDRNITGFSPSLANAGTTVTVTITGNDLANLLNLGGVELRDSLGHHYTPTNIVATATQATMDFQFPIYADNSFYSFNINNSLGCFTFPHALEIQGGQPRVLVSIVPNQGCRGQTLTALITGSNTFFMTGTPNGGINRIDFIDPVTNQQFTIFPPNITVIDSDHVSVNITVPYNIPQGWYNIRMEAFGGTIFTLSPGFEVTCTRIQGFVYLDVDSNGVYSPGDTYLPGKLVLLMPDSIIATTGPNGEYNFAVDSGQYVISMVPDTNWIVTSTPQVYTVLVDSVDTLGLSFGLKSLSTVGIFNLSVHGNGLIVYPNPTKEKINVLIKNPDFKLYDSRIIDVNGRILKQFTMTEDNFTLDMNEWSAGIYYLLLTNMDKGTVLRGKIVKY